MAVRRLRVRTAARPAGAVGRLGQVRAARLIAATELRRRIRIRTFVLTALVGPIVLATLISLAFGGSGFDATIGVVDDDGSPASEQFVAGVAEADVEGLEFAVRGSAADARAAVDDGDLGAAVVVPAGFADSLTTGSPADLVVLTSSDDAVSAEVARAVAQSFTDRANAARLAAATSAAAGGPVPDDDVLAAIDLPVDVAVTGSGGDVSPAAYFGPSMGLLFLFLGLSDVARNLLAERRTGLLDRVRAGPVGELALLAGKGAAVVAVGVTSLLVIWLVTSVALGADWGDPVGVVLLIVAAGLALGGIAGLIAGLARTEAAADNLATALALVFSLLGGAFIPLGNLPETLERISLLTPTGVALRGFAELSAGGGDATSVVPFALALVGWALATGLLAVRLLPRTLGAR
jgi:ABC-2 type transport system permease protein